MAAVSVKRSIIPKARITRPTRSSSSGVIKLVEPKCQTATYQKTYIIRCIRVWNVVADELNLPMNTLDDFKQAMVEYYKTALSNYDCENPCTFKSVCLKCNKFPSLVSLSHVAFNFVIMYFNYSYILVIFWARCNWLTLLRNSCDFFFVTLFDYPNVFMLCWRS